MSFVMDKSSPTWGVGIKIIGFIQLKIGGSSGRGVGQGLNMLPPGKSQVAIGLIINVCHN